MSTLPGGPADKAGFTHEALWAIYAILEIIHGRADSIYIEEPGIQGAEFQLQRGQNREYWQAKRHVLSQSNWSLRRLKTEGVLDFFLERASVGDFCVFASISDAPQLRQLVENAADAKDWQTFQTRFLNDQRKKDFVELIAYWDNIPEPVAFEYLRRIKLEGAKESTLQTLLLRDLQAIFTGAPLATYSVLQQLYVGSVHQTLTAAAIQEHLSHCGIGSRVLGDIAQESRLLRGVSDSYVAGQRRKLIRAKPIHRAFISEQVTRLRDSSDSLDLLFAGPAGGGKSGCLLQLTEELRLAGIPVLAFRLDSLNPVSTTEALGRELDLPESPAVVLARCFQNQTAVLVIDQLDFISTTSGRHPAFFDTLAALIDEIRGLRSICRIHLALACRQFDFDNDHRFRQLLVHNEKPILIPQFTESEIKEAIQAAGGEPSRLSARQVDLLRLPQNLSLFLETGLVSETSPGFISQKGLFDVYWDMKRRSISTKRPGQPDHWMPVIQTLISEMNARQKLTVPRDRMDGVSPEYLDLMVSEGVLTFDSRSCSYGFGHESFFDYCHARAIASGSNDFIAFLETDGQDLFRRAQLRQVLVYSRDADPARFLNYAQKGLANQKIRPHLKLLILELLAAFPDPSDEEMKLLLPWLQSELDCRRQGKSNPNKMATRAFDSFFISRTLFTAADRMGLIHRWLNSGEEWLENEMASYFRWQMQWHAERVAAFMEPFVGKGGNWQHRLRYLCEFGNLEKSRRFFDLFLRLLDDGTLDDARDRFVSNGTFWSMLGELPQKEPAWLIELAAHWLHRRVAVATEKNQQELSLHDTFGVEGLIESARVAPADYVKYLMPAILLACETFAYDGDNSFRRDGVWNFRHRGQYIGLDEAYISGLEESYKIIGQNDHNALRQFIDELRSKKLYTANALLFNIYLIDPVAFAEEAMVTLANEPDRLLCGFVDSAHWTSRCLLERASAHCSEQTFQKLEKVIFQYATPHEKSEKSGLSHGHAAFNLASALSPERLSSNAKQQLEEWRKKFTAPDGEPRGVRVYTVSSPVPPNEAAGYSDTKWLDAIAQYNVDRGGFDWQNPEMGVRRRSSKRW